MNEQAISYKICNLLDGDARAAYKTTDFDFRDYKKLKMFIHAEKTEATGNIKDGDITAFVRLGSDFTTNYYEYEIPLILTPWETPATAGDIIWPSLNNMDIDLALLVSTKQARNEALNRGLLSSVTTPYTISDPAHQGGRITVVGAPSISDVRAVMVGVRNPKRTGNNTSGDDGTAKCAEVWFNEFRLTDFNEKSGWAANARVATNLADLGNLTVSGSYSSAGFGSIEKKVSERQKEGIAQFDVATNIELGKFLPEKSGIKIPVHYDYSQTISDPQYNPLDPDILYSEQTREMTRQQRDSLRELTVDITRRQNLNLMNVRKDRVGAAKKPQLWDIENFDLSYAYSEINHHNNDVASNVKKTYRGGLGYNFSVNPKNVKPFQKAIKSKSLAIVRDFNFYYLPKLLSFRTDMYRNYETRLLRNKSAALIKLEPTYTKQWDWSRIYDLKYDLSQSLKLDYNATVNAYVLEPDGLFERGSSNYESYRDTVWNSIKSFGATNRFSQQANVNYTVPFNKIPILNWVTLTARYGVKFRWDAPALAYQPRFGNTVENSRDIQINGGLRMGTLYDKVPFLKKARQELQGNLQKPGMAPGRPGMDKEKEKGKDPKTAQPDKAGKPAANDSTDEPKKDYLKIVLNYTLSVLTSVRDVNFTYSRTNGTVMPGFMPEAGPLGNNWNNNAPGLGFIFGSQEEIWRKAAQSGWLTKDSLQSKPYITRTTENLNIRASLEPIRNFKIDLNAERAYSSNFQGNYVANSEGVFNEKLIAPSESGNFSMSYFIWPTAFKKDNKGNISPVFEQMLDARLAIAQRLASGNPNSVGVDSLGYPKGYGPTQPEVLRTAFMAVYAGKDPATTSMKAFPRIPYPNWRLSFNASQGFPSLKEYFQSFNITHAYRSAYSVSGFQSDVKYKEDDLGFATALDNAENFIPQNHMAVITITEQFGPFLGIDVTMKNSMLAKFEYKKTRNLSLSFANNQLTEIKTGELVIGSGYRFKSVPFKVRSLVTNKTMKLKSDLNVKLDFSMRDSKTVIRLIEDNTNQVSTGAKVFSINFSADYMVSQKMNIRLYYEQTINRPHVSGQIATSNTNGGISIRFTLAQ
jgi:cell surface protein SprA